MDIEKITEIANEVANFNSCYKDCELWGGRDMPVSSPSLLRWLIDNPHMAEIALKINKMNNLK